MNWNRIIRSNTYHSSSSEGREWYQLEKWPQKNRGNRTGGPKLPTSRTTKNTWKWKGNMSDTPSTFSFFLIFFLFSVTEKELAAMTVWALHLPLCTAGGADSALLHCNYFSILFISPRLPSFSLLGIKWAKWGRAFKRQKLWMYPSLS